MSKSKGFAASGNEEYPEVLGATTPLINDDGVEESEVDFPAYFKFVDFVTSAPSKDYDKFSIRLDELNQEGLPIQRLMTGAIGINSEAGEFLEIVKKIIFQAKPWNQSNKEHLISELGDIMWYITQACIALDVSMDEVVQGNVSKLLKRYPEGVFESIKSEVRATNDR